MFSGPPGFLLLSWRCAVCRAGSKIRWRCYILMTIVIFARHPMKTASTLPSLFTRRRGRGLLWAVAAVVLTWLLAWSIVPPVLKHQLEHRASAELGRSVSVGAIKFKPWTLELTVHDLSIATQDGQSAQLAIKRIHVDAELETLLRLAPVVQTLEVDAPALKLRRIAEGRYDIDDILARLAGGPPSSGEPLQFALFNLKVRDGSLAVDDRPADRKHLLRNLNLSVPFVSNLPSRREVTVTPALAFTLNGAAFESQVASTPFAPSRKSEVQLRIQSMDLQPYLPYIPADLPVRLRQATLDTDLQLQFVQAQRAQLIVRGQVQLSGVELADGADAPLLTLDTLSVGLDELRPLEKVLRLGTVVVKAPRLQAGRDASGRLNLALAPVGDAAGAPVAAISSAQPVANAWSASMTRLELRDGSVDWLDAAITPQANLQVRGLTLDVDDLVWPMERPASIKGSLALQSPVKGAAAVNGASPAAAATAAARLVFDGNASDRQAALQLTVSDAPLDLATPYVAQFLTPQLRGQLNADMALRWSDLGLQLSVPSMTLDRVAMVHDGKAKQPDLPQVQRVAVSAATVDLARRTLAIERLEVTQPQLAVTRDADRRWMFESWLTSASMGNDRGVPSAGAAAQAAWTGRLAQLQVQGGIVSFDDRAQAKPVQLAATALQLDLRNIALDGSQPTVARLSARVAAGKSQPGTVDYRGSIQLEPLQTQGRLQVAQWPLHALEPYFGAGLNVEILRADAGFNGDVAFAATPRGPRLSLKGDTVLEDFRANSFAAGGGEAALAQELLNWKVLGLRGVDLSLAPGQPLRLSVRETTLSDFFARVIVHETGRINLQDLVRGEAPSAPSAPAGGPLAAGVAVAATSSRGGAQSAPPGAVAGANALAPQIRIGPISLVQGRVYFSDRFVKPNYSANLSELTGKLSAFSSASAQDQAAMADLELRGRAEGTASLEIVGKLNPLVEPLALDIKGVVRDLELPPLSPYAIKYAGHGIERGKLSVDVAYQVLPNGQLTASNQVVLNQLAFGDKVDGAPNSLPVKLAVALLADRNGVIDINLPISGSLNDPQFRLGPVIVKVIVNLIGKALTAPFTLLASAFGSSSDELSQVAFAPGSDRLLPQARGTLDKVAQALTQRPALKMTVVGTANLEVEREAFKRLRLQALLQAEKRRAQVTAGQVPTESDTAPAESLPDPAQAAQASELLQQLFARSEITKPRDLAGKALALAPPDMEALLLANIPVDAQSMRDLALRRGVAVKDYLASRQLPVERLFLGAARLPEPDAAWTPRAELKLGTN